MIKKITIRKAHGEDLSKINELLYCGYLADQLNLPETYNEIPKEVIPQAIFTETLADHNSAFFVAEDCGQIVGVINICLEINKGDNFTKPYRRANIQELVEIKGYTKFKIKELLIEKAEKWAESMRATYLTTVIYSYDKPMLNFYTASKFNTYSVRLNKNIGD